jgi:SAM-dependent methyltransferase
MAAQIPHDMGVGYKQPDSPLTGRPDVSLLRCIDTKTLAAAWQRELGIDIRGQLSGIAELRQYRCLDSGLEFFAPREAAGDSGLYEALQKFPWYYMPDKWEYDRALEDLRGRSRVLEIGCGRGEFLHRLAQTGAGVAEGLELNPQAAEEARKRGSHAEVATVEDWVQGGHSPYDAVCAFQVLEHIPQPRPFLTAMLQLLRPGGRMILSVPDAESFLRHDPWNLLDLPPHHMTRWSGGTFRWLASQFGMTLLGLLTEPLAPYHAAMWSTILARRLCPVWPVPQLSGMVLGRLLALAPAVRRRIRGHTLYVCLQKGN